MTDERLCFDVI